MTTAKQLYRNIIKEHELSWCWACGASDEWFDKPADWYAEWWIERSHIVRSPRVIDRRLIVLLCSWCHQTAHGARIITAARQDWPRLQLHHLLWLKKHRDPEYWDRAFIRQHCVHALPAAQVLPGVYRREYARRHAA
jgi:hypothetical protein